MTRLIDIRRITRDARLFAAAILSGAFQLIGMKAGVRLCDRPPRAWSADPPRLHPILCGLLKLVTLQLSARLNVLQCLSQMNEHTRIFK